MAQQRIEPAAGEAENDADLSWPKGGSQRERMIDLAWLIFLLGAIGLDLGRLTQLVWYGADLAALLTLWFRSGPVLMLARRNVPLLAWPVVAVISTIWSIAPELSLYRGLQLGATMLVGIVLALHAGLFRVLQLYFVALCIAAVLSLVYVVVSPSNAVWPTGEWQGLFRHKNGLGSGMGTLVTIGVCLFLQGWRRGFTAALTALGVAMLLMSRSGTAILTVAVTMSLLVPVLLYRQGYSVFFFAFGAGLAALAATWLYIDAAGIHVMDTVLESMGKDSSLTGRTVLWDFAAEAIDERPLLGWGYQAWWEASGPAVETLREVLKQELWMFHNNFIEIRVAFGILGVIVFWAAILFVLATSLRAFLADPTYVNAWPMFFLALVLAQATAENPLFNNHGLNDVLLVAIASNGVRRKVLASEQRAAHSGQARSRLLHRA